MRTWTGAVVLALLLGSITLTAAQPPVSQPDKDKLPPPGTAGNPDNVPFIGKKDPQGNPVRLAKATGHVSNYSEDKVVPYTLPDPLVTFDKRRVSTTPMWFKQRRPEILKFFRDEIYGAIPKNAPKVAWEVTQTDDNARKGTAIMRRIVGRMGDKKDGPQMNLIVLTPAKATGPVPMLLHLTFAPRAGGRPPGGFDLVGETLGRGWGYAALGYTDIQPDRPNRWTDGVIGLTLTQGQTKPAANEWGTISAWAWGLSRTIDYFQTDKSVNAKQIAISGASRLGKTVLWASALDERVAAVFAAVPGEMGASLIRRDWGETLDDMAERFGYQFAGNLQKWVGKWNDLPVDQHFLIALSAPRPVLVSGGIKDQWSDPKGQFLALAAAGPVYRLLGAKDLGVRQMPPLDKPVADGSLAYHYHSSGHTVLPADWKLFFDFAGRHFKAATTKQPANGPSE
jgi:hypothetical protein